MKILLVLLIFLSSISAAAQSSGQPIQLGDGSYYNNDLLYHDDVKSVKSPMPSATYIPIVKDVRVPRERIKIKYKKRDPSGFVEVRSGGKMGDFKEVGGRDTGTFESRGSR